MRDAQVPSRARAFAVGLAIVTLVGVDQAAKFWAWRTVSTVRINAGGDQFVSRSMSAWFAGPITGAILDVVNFALVLLALGALFRRPASPGLRPTGVLMLTGWASNLLDRLGLHFLTAPGSLRGVIDFVPIGRHFYNLADLYIGLGTAGFATCLLLSTVRRPMRRRRRMRLLLSRAAAPLEVLAPRIRPSAVVRPSRRGEPVRRWAGSAAAVGLVGAATAGAVTYGGISAPLAAAESAQTSAITYSTSLSDTGSDHNGATRWGATPQSATSGPTPGHQFSWPGATVAPSSDRP
ncbi:signal peptidase II [Jatrophihabitans telluris]|uniref:Signal peptidase II n=1 Tax=Jatrophihabitans telluris TaxID=2038343 RepID=A0ABY4QWL6_9ACTN|nr:signal peptidase II [Jatrophihabitans telluris]UQX87863.1 signal peptidase II [Jatrophihabitans telluris]